MGTKNNPGNFDCYKNAHPDEPMFVLLGRDPVAASLVSLWADAREAVKPGDPKVREAKDCATNMLIWCAHEAKRWPSHALKLMPFDMLASELRRRGAMVLLPPSKK